MWMAVRSGAAAEQVATSASWWVLHPHQYPPLLPSLWVYWPWPAIATAEPLSRRTWSPTLAWKAAVVFPLVCLWDSAPRSQSSCWHPGHQKTLLGFSSGVALAQPQAPLGDRGAPTAMCEEKLHYRFPQKMPQVWEVCWTPLLGLGSWDGPGPSQSLAKLSVLSRPVSQQLLASGWSASSSASPCVSFTFSCPLLPARATLLLPACVIVLNVYTHGLI